MCKPCFVTLQVTETTGKVAPMTGYVKSFSVLCKCFYAMSMYAFTDEIKTQACEHLWLPGTVPAWCDSVAMQCYTWLQASTQTRLMKQYTAMMQNAPAANASNLSVSAASPLKLSRFLTMSVSAFSTLRNAKPTCGYTTANSALLTQQFNVETPAASSLRATAFMGAWYVSAASFCHCHSMEDPIGCT